MRRFTLFLGLAMVFAATLAFAEGAATSSVSSPLTGLAIASGFGIALAAFGGALAQGRAASTALEGVARNPGAGGRIQTMLIIGLALIESLVIYALLVAFTLAGKIPAAAVFEKALGL